MKCWRVGEALVVSSIRVTYVRINVRRYLGSRHIYFVTNAQQTTALGFEANIASIYIYIHATYRDSVAFHRQPEPKSVDTHTSTRNTSL